MVERGARWAWSGRGRAGRGAGGRGGVREGDSAPGSSSFNAYTRRGERLLYMWSCVPGPPGSARRVIFTEVGTHLVCEGGTPGVKAAPHGVGASRGQRSLWRSDGASPCVAHVSRCRCTQDSPFGTLPSPRPQRSIGREGRVGRLLAVGWQGWQVPRRVDRKPLYESRVT